MKKKLLLTLATGMIMMGLIACSSNETPTESTGVATTEETETAPSGELTTDENLDALGEVEVDKNLLSVEITLPAEYSEGVTQDGLDEEVEMGNFKSATLNDDGSITYTMSKDQHTKLLEDITEQFNTSLQEMVASESTPNITEISANDDFTSFIVKTSSTELSMTESLYSIIFYMYGGMYGIFNESTPDNIVVEFYNSDSGELIETANSQDME